MQDRPTYDELLAAVERFLDEEIVPHTPGSRGFHARVAANIIRIVRRELAAEEANLEAEWAGLDSLLGVAPRPVGREALRRALRQRTAELCQRIQAGEADAGPFRRVVLEHLWRTVRAKLSVSDPEWLRRSEAAPGEGPGGGSG